MFIIMAEVYSVNHVRPFVTPKALRSRSHLEVKYFTKSSFTFVVLISVSSVILREHPYPMDTFQDFF